MIRILAGAIVATALLARAAGVPAQEVARFEVASVKPSRPGAIGGGFDATPGRFGVENLPLSDVIRGRTC